MKVGDLVRIKSGASRFTHKRFIDQIGIICEVGKWFSTIQIVGIRAKFKFDEIVPVKKCP